MTGQEERTLYHASAQIRSKHAAGPGHCRIVLHAPRIARAARPGQFVHVRAMDHGTLRRPISIHRVPSRSEIELLFKVVGEGTALLTEARPGATLDVLGPTGKGFAVPSDLKTAVLVAGGIGAAPLVFLWEALARRTVPALFLLGAADRGAVPLRVGETRDAAPFMPKARAPYLCLPSLERGGQARLYGRSALGAAARKSSQSPSTLVMLEKGKSGYRGLITSALERYLATTDPDRLAVFTCGPRAMMAAVARITAEAGVACQVSVEQRMGCGLGACMGCSVPVKTADGRGEYKRACVDGPVFAAGDLDWGRPW
jgi:dihydroorotate dehydrogenase electron transfer subunit